MPLRTSCFLKPSVTIEETWIEGLPFSPGSEELFVGMNNSAVHWSRFGHKRHGVKRFLWEDHHENWHQVALAGPRGVQILQPCCWGSRSGGSQAAYPALFRLGQGMFSNNPIVLALQILCGPAVTSAHYHKLMSEEFWLIGGWDARVHIACKKHGETVCGTLKPNQPFTILPGEPHQLYCVNGVAAILLVMRPHGENGFVCYPGREDHVPHADFFSSPA